MIEITAMEQNKEKNKEMRTVSEISGIILNTPTFALQGPEGGEREKGTENI